MGHGSGLSFCGRSWQLATRWFQGMVIRAAVSLTVIELANGVHARTGTTHVAAIAHISARAAVARVAEDVYAHPVADGPPRPAVSAGALDAVRRCSAADVAAGAAVGGVLRQI